MLEFTMLMYQSRLWFLNAVKGLRSDLYVLGPSATRATINILVKDRLCGRHDIVYYTNPRKEKSVIDRALKAPEEGCNVRIRLR